MSSSNLEQSIGDLDDNYSVTLRIFAPQGIRFDDLDSSSNDLEQNIDDLDYTSIYFDNLDLTLNDLELSTIEL